MFVAIKYGSDPKSDQVLGPFTDEVKGAKWVRSYLNNVEGWDGLDPEQASIEDAGWYVKEVEFVDEDDLPVTSATAEDDLVSTLEKVGFHVFTIDENTDFDRIVDEHGHKLGEN